jgi:hypothetical protein
MGFRVDQGGRMVAEEYAAASLDAWNLATNTPAVHQPLVTMVLDMRTSHGRGADPREPHQRTRLDGVGGIPQHDLLTFPLEVPLVRPLSLVLASLLLAGATSYTAPAVAQEEESVVPDGCFTDWFCYLPPMGDTVNPELKDGAFKAYLGALLLFPSAAMWPISDAGKRPLTDDDLMALLKARLIPLAVVLGGYVVSYLLIFTIIGIPLAYLGMLVMSIINLVNYFYIWPMTQIHIVNRALNREPVRSTGKVKSKFKRSVGADDE